MPDPVTGAVVAKAAGLVAGEKKERAALLRRVLGPPADALGEALGRWVEYRTRNVGRVLEKANAKLGERGDEPGEVPIRVAGPLFEEGSYCDDDVVLEYLGGVLASSRSGVSRDDRGTRWVKLITGLSAYEIRLHYLLYAGAGETLLGQDLNVEWGNERSYGDLRVVFELDEIVAGMDFVQEEDPNVCIEAMFALARESLISGNGWAIAEKSLIDEQLGKDTPGEASSIYFSPSTVGIQLFMWAQGLGAEWRSFASPDTMIPDIGVSVPHGQRVADLEARAGGHIS